MAFIVRPLGGLLSLDQTEPVATRARAATCKFFCGWMRHMLSSGQSISAAARSAYFLLALGDTTGNHFFAPFTPSQMSHRCDQPGNNEERGRQAQEEAQEARSSAHL